jgi:hypothetical protein
MITTKKMFGTILISAGVLSIVAGVMVMQSDKTTPTVTPMVVSTTAATPTTTENLPINTADSMPVNTPNSIEGDVTATPVATTTTSSKETAEEKGKEFTKLIISKFDKKYFKLKEWRSDKYEDGVYPEANKYPDLEFEFTLRETKSVFAVECKWRKNYYKNGVEWAKEYQLTNYKNFAKERSIPVFVAIGVGGTPNNPDEVFVVPLEKMKDNFLSQTELKKYEKADFKDKNFFFDGKNETLK